MNMQQGVPYQNNFNTMRTQSSANVPSNNFNSHPTMMNPPLNLPNNQALPESITYQLMDMINSALFQLQQQQPQNPQFIMPSPTVQNQQPVQPSSLHSISEDTSIALSHDVDYLYQEFDKIQKQQIKQKEINKSLEVIVREKYQKHKKEEREKKFKKDIATKYQNPSNRQHNAAIKIQRWFRGELSKKKDKKIIDLKGEVELLKYQVQRLQIDQKTTLQLVRLLFEQVQLLTREVREKDSSEDQ